MTSLVAQAVGMFAVTNVDDILVLALLFGRVAGERGGVLRVVLGQYLGFAAILLASVVGASGAGLLPGPALPYLGLLPLLLGLRAGWAVWRDRRAGPDRGRCEEGDVDGGDDGRAAGRVATWQVGLVTLANGGDNIGVYVPVFAIAGTAGLAVYCVVFLAGVGLWCALGLLLATRPPTARVLGRRGHLLLPVVLVGIGLVILVEGGAFGLRLPGR